MLVGPIETLNEFLPSTRGCAMSVSAGRCKGPMDAGGLELARKVLRCSR
jgi:hypothetical protein